jgi:hypothetical protein
VPSIILYIKKGIMSSFWMEPIGSDLILHNKYGKYSKNELEYQLKTYHLTVKELSQAYSLTEYQMVHVFRSLNIIERNSVNDTRVMDSVITPKMHQILLGTLLGDAYMTEPKAYQLAHSIYQASYLYHIAGQLYNFVATIGDRESKTGRSTYLWTFRHDCFIPYFQRFYSRGKTKKYLRMETLQGLDPMGLAYWYMDDGKFNEYGAYLCVGNISTEEGAIILEYLKNVFSLNATFQVHDKKKGYYNIYILADSRCHFYKLIEPYVIPSMRYKMIGDPPNSFFSEEEQKERHNDLCLSCLRDIRYRGEAFVFEPPKKKAIEKIHIDMVNGRQISKTEFRSIPTEEALYRMFVEEGLTDIEVSRRTGYGRNRIAKLRVSMGVKNKSRRYQGV